MCKISKKSPIKPQYRHKTVHDTAKSAVPKRNGAEIFFRN